MPHYAAYHKPTSDARWQYIASTNDLLTAVAVGERSLEQLRSFGYLQADTHVWEVIEPSCLFITMADAPRGWRSMIVEHPSEMASL